MQNHYESILTPEHFPAGDASSQGTLDGAALNAKASQGQGLIAGQGSNAASGENNSANGSEKYCRKQHKWKPYRLNRKVTLAQIRTFLKIIPVRIQGRTPNKECGIVA